MCARVGDAAGFREVGDGDFEAEKRVAPGECDAEAEADVFGGIRCGDGRVAIQGSHAVVAQQKAAAIEALGAHRELQRDRCDVFCDSGVERVRKALVASAARDQELIRAG